MFIKIENLKLHYKVIGQGRPLLLLPGWGCGIEHFNKLQEHFAKNFTTYAIDLPGFGLSDAPPTIWGNTEYANLVTKFINAIKIINPVLIGHSFGGKIIIELVASGLINAEKIVLISSAGVKLPKSLKLILKIYFFKFIKLFISRSNIELYKKKCGSSDYKNASSHMRSVLVKAVNENIIKLLPKIKVPTLLLWGDKDTATPLKAGKIMQKMISGSRLRIFDNSGHFPFLDNYAEVIIELDKFLK